MARQETESPGRGKIEPTHEGSSFCLAAENRAQTLAGVISSPLRAVIFDLESFFVHKKGVGAPRLAPDTHATLTALRFLGLKVAVIGDSNRRMAFEDAGLTNLFEKTVFFEKNDPFANDGAVLTAIMREWKFLSRSFFYVGRRVDDAITVGMRAGIVGDTEASTPPGAHRVKSLAASVDFIREEIAFKNTRDGFDRTARNLVADLRGLPSENSRAPERRLAGTAALADLLRRAQDGDETATQEISSLARGAITAEENGMDARGTLLDAWPLLIPSRLKGLCFPVDLNGDAVVVFCVTPVARNEITFAARAIIAAVRRLPGCSGVNRVVCRL